MSWVDKVDPQLLADFDKAMGEAREVFTVAMAYKKVIDDACEAEPDAINPVVPNDSWAAIDYEAEALTGKFLTDHQNENDSRILADAWIEEWNMGDVEDVENAELALDSGIGELGALVEDIVGACREDKERVAKQVKFLSSLEVPF